MRERYRTAFLSVLALLITAVNLAFSQKAVSVTMVTTAEELKAAMDGGARHVHITNHLDLTTLTASTNDSLFGPGPLLQSVTVRLCQFAVNPQSYQCDIVSLTVLPLRPNVQVDFFQSQPIEQAPT
jgi:hypothetical protein